jgi:hypothetical protein
MADESTGQVLTSDMAEPDPEYDRRDLTRYLHAAIAAMHFEPRQSAILQRRWAELTAVSADVFYVPPLGLRVAYRLILDLIQLPGCHDQECAPLNSCVPCSDRERLRLAIISELRRYDAGQPPSDNSGVKGTPGRLPPVNCAYAGCQNPSFYPVNRNARYCSPGCRSKAFQERRKGREAVNGSSQASRQG